MSDDLYQHPPMPDNYGQAMSQPQERQALYSAMRFRFADREEEFFGVEAMAVLYRDSVR